LTSFSGLAGAEGAGVRPLTHYGLERLLYRLSISPHAPNYLLKGALLFSLWYDQPHRPTRDADLLGFGPEGKSFRSAGSSNDSSQLRQRSVSAQAERASWVK
jgi:hypothetical protein